MKHPKIKLLLPEVFQRTDQKGSLLYGILEVMEALTEPSENILQNLHSQFNIYTTSDKFLPFFAKWVDLDRFFPALQNQTTSDIDNIQAISPGRLRELILAATQLSKLRGTSAGLTSFLETATGLDGFEINENVVPENGDVLPFHIKISAPQAARESRVLIERIIEQEKPAYVTYNLEFNP